MKTATLIFRQHLITRQWRWKLIASNGRILGASSEGFFNKKDCIDNAKKTGKALVELTTEL